MTTKREMLPITGKMTEDLLLKWFFQWSNYVFLNINEEPHALRNYMFHIPNEGKRSAFAGKVMKDKGLTPGAADICLFVPAKKMHGMFIELKRPGTEIKLTPAQSTFLARAKQVGWHTVIANDLRKLQLQVINYLDEYDLSGAINV